MGAEGVDVRVCGPAVPTSGRTGSPVSGGPGGRESRPLAGLRSSIWRGLSLRRRAARRWTCLLLRDPVSPERAAAGAIRLRPRWTQGRRSRCSKNGKPKRATGVGHRQRWRTQRTLVWSNALKSSGPWKQDAPRNGRRATVRGDVDAAVRVGKALKGVASEGKHDDVRQSALARHAAETR